MLLRRSARARSAPDDWPKNESFAVPRLSSTTGHRVPFRSSTPHYSNTRCVCEGP
jgi:hypothetical protein